MFETYPNIDAFFAVIASDYENKELSSETEREMLSDEIKQE